jgi:hypothetical protein
MSSTSAPGKMATSIYDAAAPTIYNASLGEVQSAVAAFQSDKPAASHARQFQIKLNELRDIHLSLPLEVHAADSEAWRQVDQLRLHLQSRKFECAWAACPPGVKDRSRPLRYTITVIPREQEFQLLSSFGVGAQRQPNTIRGFPPSEQKADEPRLRDLHFRLRIIDRTLTALGIPPVTFDWGSDTRQTLGGAERSINLPAPSLIRKCLENEKELEELTAKQRAIDHEGVQFLLVFSTVWDHITPTACTTIGLKVTGDNFKFKQHLRQLLHLVEGYKRANKVQIPNDQIVTNIRMSTEHHGYLLCDPIDLITAQGSCEYPMPNGRDRFFRQVYMLNTDPRNYRITNENDHFKTSRDAYRDRKRQHRPRITWEERDYYPPCSGTTGPIYVEMEDEDRPPKDKGALERKGKNDKRAILIHLWQQGVRGNIDQLRWDINDLNRSLDKAGPRRDDVSSAIRTELEEGIEDERAYRVQVEMYSLPPCWEGDTDLLWAKWKLGITSRNNKILRLKQDIRHAEFRKGFSISMKGFRNESRREAVDKEIEGWQAELGKLEGEEIKVEPGLELELPGTTSTTGLGGGVLYTSIPSFELAPKTVRFHTPTPEPGPGPSRDRPSPAPLPLASSSSVSPDLKPGPTPHPPPPPAQRPSTWESRSSIPTPPRTPPTPQKEIELLLSRLKGLEEGVASFDGMASILYFKPRDDLIRKARAVKWELKKLGHVFPDAPNASVKPEGEGEVKQEVGACSLETVLGARDGGVRLSAPSGSFGQEGLRDKRGRPSTRAAEIKVERDTSPRPLTPSISPPSSSRTQISNSDKRPTKTITTAIRSMSKSTVTPKIGSEGMPIEIDSDSDDDDDIDVKPTTKPDIHPSLGSSASTKRKRKLAISSRGPTAKKPKPTPKAKLAASDIIKVEAPSGSTVSVTVTPPKEVHRPNISEVSQSRSKLEVPSTIGIELRREVSELSESGLSDLSDLSIEVDENDEEDQDMEAGGKGVKRRRKWKGWRMESISDSEGEGVVNMFNDDHEVIGRTRSGRL